MSESIFTVLDTMKTETSVPGAEPKMQPHTLPRELFPTGDQFADEQALLDWATETGVLHACLQKGVRSHLIDCRAVFKACKKDDVWSNAYGQANLNDYSWKVQEKPAGKKSKEDIAKEYLASLSPAELKKFLAS